MHLVWAWSSGNLPRLTLGDIFPGIEACRDVSVRKPESRTIGASLDLQELIHVLCIAKHTHAKRIFELGTFDGFTALIWRRSSTTMAKYTPSTYLRIVRLAPKFPMRAIPRSSVLSSGAKRRQCEFGNCGLTYEG